MGQIKWVKRNGSNKMGQKKWVKQNGENNLGNHFAHEPRLNNS
jgi:hypothetical protein